MPQPRETFLQKAPKLLNPVSLVWSLWAVAFLGGVALWWRLHPRERSFDGSTITSLTHGGQHRFDIVLAYYDEPHEEVREGIQIIKSVPGIAALDPRVIVYSKGPANNITNRNDKVKQLEELRLSLNADIIYELPNVGRESDTFLGHIVKHYDQLADHTLFSQASIVYYDHVQGLLRNHFRNNLAAMSLGSYTSCSCDDCIPPYNGNPDPIHGFKRIPELYCLFNQRFCPPEGLLLCFKGQFIVNRASILRNSKEKFDWLRSVLSNTSHFVHDDPTEDQSLEFVNEKSENDPLFGHTLERAWMTIFGCNDMRLAHGCIPDFPDSNCGCYEEG
jgi:hypothetical protein